LTCSVKITQVGISEVVYNQDYLVDDQTARIFAESGVKLRQFSPPADGLVDLSLNITSLQQHNGRSDQLGQPQEQTNDIREVLDSEYFVRPL
jgi:dCMP deaminase